MGFSRKIKIKKDQRGLLEDSVTNPCSQFFHIYLSSFEFFDPHLYFISKMIDMSEFSYILIDWIWLRREFLVVIKS